MRKKSRLFLSMASMVLTVALFCFGVYAALGVSYTISGSVVYQVKDVFVNIQTSLYVSTSESLTDQDTLDKNVATFEGGDDAQNTQKLSYSDGLSTYNPDTGVITNSGEAVSKTSENIPINYGSYEIQNEGLENESAKGFAYYIVVSVTNYGTESVSVTLTNNINNEQTNSLTKLSENTTIAGRTADKTYTTKHIVIGMALNDATKSVSDVNFNVPILIERGETTTPTLVATPEKYTIDEQAKTITINADATGDVVIGKGDETVTGLTLSSQSKNITSVYALPDCGDPTGQNHFITGLKQAAFNGCSSLKELDLSNCLGITDIPSGTTFAGGVPKSGAFGSSGLIKIKLPTSLESIGTGAFGFCYHLTEITIPKNVVHFGTSVFYACKSLVQIRNLSVRTLSGLNSNLGQEILTDATTPFTNTLETTEDGFVLFTINNESDNNGVYVIGYAGQETQLNMSNIDAKGIYQYAFCDNKITSVILPNTITSIGDYAFDGCSSLTDITIPDSVTSIGSNAISNCSSLTEITIPDSVESIGGYAFSGCTSLTEITIGSGVKSIGYSAFNNCSSLTQVTIDSEYVYQNASTSTSACGYLLRYATTVYVKQGLTGTNKSLDSSSFTKVDNGDGYWKYTKN